jgi:hypothetical protein
MYRSGVLPAASAISAIADNLVESMVNFRREYVTCGRFHDLQLASKILSGHFGMNGFG